MNKRESVHHYHAANGYWLELRVSSRGIRSISYIGAPRAPVKNVSDPIMKRLVGELDRYFSGERVEFTGPFDPVTGTPFQRRVWQELSSIPWGETRSYGEVAAAIGNPKAARAVGSANKRNPLPIVVPCHRVIAGDGSLGGYNSGLETKKTLLKLEGVELKSGW